MTYEDCEWCVYRDKRNPDICRNCSHNTDSARPTFELGKVDVFKLAEGLKKKRQEQDNKKPEPVPEENAAEQPAKLGKCPYCGKISLFFNEINKKHECLNLECKSRNLFSNVIWPESSSQAKKAREENAAGHQEELSNPLLLGVKMFLADIRSWRRQYREGEYVCADFAREVYDAATKRGIRCGYVVISFAHSNVGHAIVAFETDYGLRFFEPQNGNEEDVVVGRPYLTQAEGIESPDTIRLIEVSWNDGTNTRID